jgi:hypothetical protein
MSHRYPRQYHYSQPSSSLLNLPQAGSIEFLAPILTNITYFKKDLQDALLCPAIPVIFVPTGVDDEHVLQKIHLYL